MIDFDGPDKSPDDYFEDFKDEVEEEIDQAVNEAQDLAKQRVPVDTGRLRDSVSIDLQEDVLYSDVDYAPHQDLGTIYIDPTYFMRDSAIDAFTNSIQRLRS